MPSELVKKKYPPLPRNVTELLTPEEVAAEPSDQTNALLPLAVAFWPQAKLPLPLRERSGRHSGRLHSTGGCNKARRGHDG